MILVPQVISQEKKKPKKHHHHHHKVIPVVHSGKVIHAHHHHGKVDHVHGHDGKAKHDHKHSLSGAHKHSHFGVGSHKHTHAGKAVHDHKHAGKAEHKHGHTGKGSIHHVHEKHHHHQPHHPHHPKPKHPTKKFVYPFGFDGGSEAYSDNPRIKIDAEILRALTPALNPITAAVSSSYTSGNGRIIQIRIPDENDPNAFREIDFDPESDVAVLKKNYIALGENTDAVEYTANLDEDLGDETEDTDGESDYQLGDGYKLAASAAARAAVSAEDNRHLAFTEDDAMEPALPSFNRNNVLAYSDAYHYQY